MPQLFSDMDRVTPIVASVANHTLTDAACNIRNSLSDGADGILVHLEKLNKSEVTKDSLKNLFFVAEDKPIMVVNYGDEPDDELMQLELAALEAGAGCLDIRGDMFDKGARFQCTNDETAIKRQKDTISEIHKADGQALISAHIFDTYLAPPQVIDLGKRMEDRGADIVKIVMPANNQKEFMEGCQSTFLLHEAIKVPILHILLGPYTKTHRIIAPTFGSCLVFCVQNYIPGANMNKPLLRNVRAIYDNFNFKHFTKEGLQ